MTQGMSGSNGVNAFKNMYELMKKKSPSTINKDEKSDSLSKLFSQIQDADISDLAKKTGQYYEAFSMVSEKTYAKFVDDQGNEIIMGKESYKLTYQAIWEKTSKLPVDPTKSEAEKLDDMLGDWGSDEVSDRLIKYADAVYNLINKDDKYSDMEQKDPKKFLEWAKGNILSGFNQALSMLQPFIKDNDPLKDVIKMTYDKTMKGLEERFAPSEDKTEEVMEDKGIEEAYYQKTEIQYERSFIQINLADEQ
ncbi:MAG: hypothetical protein C0601_04845 [Candidatus Muiribacterium halophilum]|uniref:DUF5610 domain-containing protein n=1 Tax=Muiribacterium halophilum TaxID=2053465 RepID=A0A2N5ZI29_MUIH1|nr:MAG: hypothetical protein C0601_04845 [Candidatus Muirbacterium halophilum]